MEGFARSILEANERASRYFSGSQLRGRVRFGASEDFVSSRLPEVLADFVRLHPLVDLALTVDLSAALYQMLDDGELDLVLCKRRGGGMSGVRWSGVTDLHGLERIRRELIRANRCA
jgi:DNA-binding transcriptional LysR family regulator